MLEARGQRGFAWSFPRLGLCFLEQATHQLWGERGPSQLTWACPACPSPRPPGSQGGPAEGSRCQGLEGQLLGQGCPGGEGRMRGQGGRQGHLELALGKHFHHSRVKMILVSV